MIILQGAMLFAAALLGGALNSVAGGGSFLVLPALVVTGIGTKAANATTTVALWPGAVASAGAYRKELIKAERSLLWLLGSISIAGGVLGALIFLNTSQKTFSHLIPYLMLVATVLFTFGGPAAERLRNQMATRQISPRVATIGVALLQIPISLYGGFFGGGMSILILATLSLTGMKNLHTMNALKVTLAACINGVAVLTFIIAGAVAWPQALVMIVGAIIGGYGGARIARRLDQRLVRRFVILVGCLMTIIFFIVYGF
jgi:uncharacterized membrane protein YfcA